MEKKGVAHTLRAIAALRQQGQAVHLSIAGNGPLRASLEQLSVDLQLSDAVEFIGDIAHDRVADWLAGLDVFVLACCEDSKGDRDGIPVALMEAMQLGVPVVSTALSGIPELVVHRQTGLLAEPGDPASLARQLAALLDSAELRGDLGKAGRQHVSGEFGKDTNIARLVHYFPRPEVS